MDTDSKLMAQQSLLPLAGGEGGRRPDEGVAVGRCFEHKEMQSLNSPSPCPLPPWSSKEVGTV